ncbi:MAG: VOC family protein [Ornithinimicrobium sp.]|uniref:VOC family protein n=1 Tax=Ornithinimicrobium sp. TaxID=1977084 RepID=UPI0017F31E74|nr:VOC family protein [Actinomycetota bacterium]
MSDPPRLRLTSVTIGAPDPRALAAFYAQLLGTTVHDEDPARPGEPPEAGWAQLRASREGGSVTVNVEYEECWQTPVWPAERGRPVATQHLDIDVEDLEEATSWAQECGARLAADQPQETVRVLLDPAGRPPTPSPPSGSWPGGPRSSWTRTCGRMSS